MIGKLKASPAKLRNAMSLKSPTWQHGGAPCVMIWCCARMVLSHLKLKTRMPDNTKPQNHDIATNLLSTLMLAQTRNNNKTHENTNINQTTRHRNGTPLQTHWANNRCENKRMKTNNEATTKNHQTVNSAQDMPWDTKRQTNLPWARVGALAYVYEQIFSGMRHTAPCMGMNSTQPSNIYQIDLPQPNLRHSVSGALGGTWHVTLTMTKLGT